MATKLAPTVEDELNALDAERSTPLVYQAIATVQGELAKTGIAKSRKNQQGSGYMYRGIDEVYAALSPLLAQHGLVVIPRFLERIVAERQSKSGGALFYVTVHAEFDFVAVADGSKHTAATYGEAMDSGDKATNKAMSAAYKYAAFLTFAIPTEGDNDADAVTHEVAARTNGFAAEDPKPAKDTTRQPGDMSKSELSGSFKTLVRNVNGCGSVRDLDELLELEDAKDVIEQTARRFPGWWATGEDCPPEFVPLKTLIAQTRDGLAKLETENV